MLTRPTQLLSLLMPALLLVAPACDDRGDDGEPEELTEEEQEKQKEAGPKPETAVYCQDEEVLEKECQIEGGGEGMTYCIELGGENVWTECTDANTCTPDENWDAGCIGSICYWDGNKLDLYSWSEPDCATPLVVNFETAPLRFETAGAAAFDINGIGECLSTDWPTLPWLALDRDGDGVIASGRELFGSGSILASGARASHGFEALAELDANGDGKITAADPAFAELVLWSDTDDDRRGELSELVPVSQVDLVAIDLNFDRRIECDERGNCGRERSAFEFRDSTGSVRSGEIIDVYLACQ